MKSRRIGILAVAVGAALAASMMYGCGGGGNDAPDREAKITCADVFNLGDVNECAQKSAGLSIGLIKTAHAAPVDIGEVSRGRAIEAAQTVENKTAQRFDGWMRAEFDAGCNGAMTWEIMPLQPLSIDPADLKNISVGGECGDMPLGERTLTATVYAADQQTVVDNVVVAFRLTR